METDKIISSEREIKTIINKLHHDNSLFNFVIKKSKKLFTTNILKIDKKNIYFDIAQDPRMNEFSDNDIISIITKVNGCKIIIKDVKIKIETSYFKIPFPTTIYYSDKRNFYRLKPIKKEEITIKIFKDDDMKELRQEELAIVLDISRKGIRIKTNANIQQNDNTYVFFNNTDYSLVKIIWQQKESNIIGFRFQEKEMKQRESLIKFMHKIQKDISITKSDRLREFL